MKKTNVIMRLTAPLFLFVGIAFTVHAAETAPDEIVRRSSEADKLPCWNSSITIRLKDKNGSDRLREGSLFTKLDPNGYDARRLIRFSSPADIKGTNVLIHEHRDGNDDIWTYLPAMKKVRRLIAANKKDSFVGTDFSYYDIVTLKVQDHTHALLKREDVNGIPCFVIESVPKTEQIKKDTGYSRTITWIRTDNFVRIKAELFDVNGRLFKIMNVHAIKELDKTRNKWLVEKVQMKNMLTGHETSIEFGNIETSAAADDQLFSANRLDRDR